MGWIHEDDVDENNPDLSDKFVQLSSNIYCMVRCVLAPTHLSNELLDLNTDPLYARREDCAVVATGLGPDASEHYVLRSHIEDPKNSLISGLFNATGQYFSIVNSNVTPKDKVT